EDGIRDFHVTGVQTCALPILDGIESRRSCAGPRCTPSRRTDLADGGGVAAGGGSAASRRAERVPHHGAPGDAVRLLDVHASDGRSEERRGGEEGGYRWAAATE